MAYSVIRYQASFELVLHPAARSAFDVMQSTPMLLDTQALPERVRLELAAQAIHCVEQITQTPQTQTTKNRSRIFQFYSPLWAAKYWQDGRPPADTLLIYKTGKKKQVSNETIEHKAWLSLLQLLGLSINTTNTAEFIDAWRQGIPKGFSEKFFGKNKLSDQLFCDLLSISRGTLVQQRQRYKSPNSTDTVDLITELAKPWKPTP